MMEQLSIFGESDTQNHFNSETWGMLEFFPAASSRWSDTCRHCLLWNGADGDKTECYEAHCESSDRDDGREGYFSIHDMPMQKNEKILKKP